uniref:Uncharacterized protein n=1 Tax=Anguilla anguilla TaxID=7936 RepID=A0A0E9T860_ANGAN
MFYEWFNSIPLTYTPVLALRPDIRYLSIYNTTSFGQL